MILPMTVRLGISVFLLGLSCVGADSISGQSAVDVAVMDVVKDDPGNDEVAPPAVGQTFKCEDSIKFGADDNSDAADCLRGLAWEGSNFSATIERPNRGKWLIRFPSPLPQGQAEMDNVAMEWYMARDDEGQLIRAPGIIVIHESGRNMAVGRLIAQGLSGMGLHAFLLQLPGYGERGQPIADEPEKFLGALRQAVADARRARDVVAVLPQVDPTRIGIQGTSLGGFVAATVCGLDNAYDRKFIFLAGGNLHDVVLSGKRDAEKVRQKLQAAGLSEQEIIALAKPVEPLRLAHRIDPTTTWLYSGLYDDVVPPQCSLALAAAARLTDDHHIQMPVDHYSGITFLPKILGEIAEIMKAELEH